MFFNLFKAKNKILIFASYVYKIQKSGLSKNVAGYSFVDYNKIKKDNDIYNDFKRYLQEVYGPDILDINILSLNVWKVSYNKKMKNPKVFAAYSYNTPQGWIIKHSCLYYKDFEQDAGIVSDLVHYLENLHPDRLSKIFLISLQWWDDDIYI